MIAWNRMFKYLHEYLRHSATNNEHMLARFIDRNKSTTEHAHTHRWTTDGNTLLLLKSI